MRKKDFVTFRLFSRKEPTLTTPYNQTQTVHEICVFTCIVTLDQIRSLCVCWLFGTAVNDISKVKNVSAAKGVFNLTMVIGVTMCAMGTFYILAVSIFAFSSNMPQLTPVQRAKVAQLRFQGDLPNVLQAIIDKNGKRTKY